MLARIEGLVSFLYKEYTKEHPRFPLVDGIEVALKWIPSLVERDQKDVTGGRINELFDADVETINALAPLVLTPEDEDIFVRCQGGMNEQSKEDVMEFIRRTS